MKKKEKGKTKNDLLFEKKLNAMVVDYNQWYSEQEKKKQIDNWFGNPNSNKFN